MPSWWAVLRRVPRPASIALGSVLVVVVALFASWAIDSALHDDRVMRNVTVGSHVVGGASEAELQAVVADLASATEERPVVVETPNGTLETAAEPIGLSLDQTATVQAVLDAGRDLGFLARPFAWFGSLFTAHRVTPAYTGDAAIAAEALDELAQANFTPPTEPTILFVDGEIAPIPGVDGLGLDLAPLVDQLVAEATGDDPLEVSLGTVPVPPTFTGENVQRLAEEANALSERGLTVVVDGRSTELDPQTLRSWMRAEPSPAGDELVLVLAEQQVAEDVLANVGAVGTPPVQLTWSVSGEGVTFSEGSPGTTCCAEDSASRVVDALRSGQPEVELDLTVAFPDHDAGWARSMEITQQVATFTTPHACCESRVQNIQRMADIVRGVVIPPGETFSLNGYVGQRTTAKGFASAGVIYNGVFTTDVGGGVSQFATTMFNAAFFAGLEIPGYMAHTIYISRYPYGREATLSYPEPDLKLQNNTPFGILLWPTYTGTSITVTLYSTPWITADQTGQRTEPVGRCTRVITERTRTWLTDGRQEVDTVSALYQPGEGVRC
jgi:vancomycin resistance protein YoaR